jgi:hypothetical protein
MVNAQHLTIAKSMALVPHIIVRAENHHVTVGISWVDNVLSSTNIIHSIIEPGDVMVIHTIIFDDDGIGVVLLSHRWVIWGLENSL